MHFTHEADITVAGPAYSVLADWSDVACLPHILTHVRATTPDELVDLGRMVIVLDGSHIEFAAQRTMCDRNTVCWQNLGDDFEYVLTIAVRPTSEGTHVVLNCSYDPPGFLSDMLEKLGFSHLFQRQLASDLERYAQTFLKHRYGHDFASLPPNGAPTKALRALGIAE